MKGYIVYWVNEDNEEQGHGWPGLSQKSAEDWRDLMNKKYPHIRHEVKEVDMRLDIKVNLDDDE